jgi:hypothetical protein
MLNDAGRGTLIGKVSFGFTASHGSCDTMHILQTSAWYIKLLQTLRRNTYIKRCNQVKCKKEKKRKKEEFNNRGQNFHFADNESFADERGKPQNKKVKVM